MGRNLTLCRVRMCRYPQTKVDASTLVASIHTSYRRFPLSIVQAWAGGDLWQAWWLKDSMQALVHVRGRGQRVVGRVVHWSEHGKAVHAHRWTVRTRWHRRTTHRISERTDWEILTPTLPTVEQYVTEIVPREHNRWHTRVSPWQCRLDVFDGLSWISDNFSSLDRGEWYDSKTSISFLR